MIWQDLQKIRKESPLIHNITNYVVMNNTANALLAIGAYPVMAHAVEEVEEMTRLANALVINIGTLSAEWIKSMIKAGKEALRRKIPVVLDPVGSGATTYRTNSVQKLIHEIRPTIIRGNASEIRSLILSGPSTKGVDSQHRPHEILDLCKELSLLTGSVIAVSGQEDIIIHGKFLTKIQNGHPLMTKVTGMGCTSSALAGAFASVNKSPFQAAVNAMALMGIAGEMAAERAMGPGTFQQIFIDILYSIKESDIDQRIKLKSQS
jgi:hydroxyethylthiazole kinase